MSRLCAITNGAGCCPNPSALLELNGRRACEQTKRLTEHKLLDVRKRLDELRKLERQLSQLVASCGEASVGACCPTLELLEHAGTEALPRLRGKHVTSSRADAA